MTGDNPYKAPQADVAVASIQPGELASRGARLGGSIVDGLIAVAIIWPAMYFTGMFDRAMEGTQSYEEVIVGALFGFAVFLVLNGYLLATRGQTIGKVAAQTRIVSIEDRKILPLWKIILLRVAPVSLASIIPLAGSILTLIDVLFIFRQDCRCVHDHIAGTIVVKA